MRYCVPTSLKHTQLVGVAGVIWPIRGERKQVIGQSALEQRHAQNPQDLMHRRVQLQLLSCYRHEDVCAHADPDLAHHGIHGGAEECVDPRVLLDRFEEQLHLPAYRVELTDPECLEAQMVGDEHRVLAGIGIFEAAAVQWVRAALLGIEEGQGNRMVGDHRCAVVGLVPPQSFEVHTPFGTGLEERSSLSERWQALVLHVISIDYIEGASLGREVFENVDVMERAVADIQETQNIAAQVEQSVGCRCRRGRTERCPRKRGQTEIDGRGFECVDCIARFDVDRLVGIELGRYRDEPLGKLGVDMAIGHAIGGV